MKYSVTVTREVFQIETFEVEAEDESDAENKAYDEALSCMVGNEKMSDEHFSYDVKEIL